MIRFTQGNLLEARAEALVNTVNTVGVMGKGIALMFKERFGENFRRYAAACKAGEVRLYSQPTARAGPVLDLARAFSTASPPPHLLDVLLAVPSIGHLDSVNELAK